MMRGVASGPAHPRAAIPTGIGGTALPLLAGGLAMGALYLFYAHVYPLHHDLGGGVLSGALAVELGAAYGDYVPYFPPMEKAWFTTAWHLGQATGLGGALAVILMSTLVSLIGAWLAYAIRRRAVGAGPAFFLVPLAILLVVPILYKNIFGLREPLVLAGLWPYLVLRVSDPAGDRIGPKLRAILGLWLGVTLLFKYLYAAVVLLVELADAAVQRRIRTLFRIENLIAGGVVACYLLLWFIDPAQREAISMMMSAIDANLRSGSDKLERALVILLPALLALLLLRVSKVPVRHIALGGAVMAGVILVAAVQERWYTHHVFPIVMGIVFLRWLAGNRLRWWGELVFLLCILPHVVRAFAETHQYRAADRELERVIEAAGERVEGKRIGVLNMHPSPYNQYLAGAGALRWNPMVNTAYVAAELAPADVPANDGVAPVMPLEHPGRVALHDRMIRLWIDRPPDALLFSKGATWPLRHVEVDWATAFSRDPRFAAILADYDLVIDHEGEEVSFSYYVRRD